MLSQARRERVRQSVRLTGLEVDHVGNAGGRFAAQHHPRVSLRPGEGVKLPCATAGSRR